MGACVTLKNNKAALLCHFVQHFVAISEIKLEYMSENNQLGSKSVCFCSCVSLQFDIWMWKTIWQLFQTTLSFTHNFVAIGEFRLELQPRDLQNWWFGRRHCSGLISFVIQIFLFVDKMMLAPTKCLLNCMKASGHQSNLKLKNGGV